MPLIFILSKYPKLSHSRSKWQGIYYFSTRPGLIQPFFSAALTAVITAALIVVLTCFFGYLPQVTTFHKKELLREGSVFHRFPWSPWFPRGLCCCRW